MKRALTALVFLLFSFCAYSQKETYAAATIPDSLKQNANAVVRLDQTDISILSQRKMKIRTKRVVTVLNERGQNAIQAVEFYDKSSAVNTMDAVIFNAFGKEIKKIKKSDFKDQSASDGNTIFSDNRMIYLDYTPTDYPFTISYESEKTTSTTAFIPSWMPVSDYYVSVEKSVLNVAYPDNLGFKKKEQHFSKLKVTKVTDTPIQLAYESANIMAHKRESISPAFDAIFPKVMLGLGYFNLEGIDGNATSWKEFGLWYDKQILTGTTEIPEETKNRVKALVAGETDPVKKARLIYKFVQEKSRYVSIQVGIGGFKPMYAKDVDRLGYGDCKALSNYTRALLDVVGVPSYNTILYGTPYKKNIDADFVSMQGNHMILSIPDGEGYIWLECTSQSDPFGYQANFTDDREVLVIKPEGGEIVRTQIYPDSGNTQLSKGTYVLADDGALSGKISIVSSGTQYSQKARIESMQPNEKEAYYKDYWDNINNLKISKSGFYNDKEKIAFTENLEVDALGYGAHSGNSMVFAVNAYNQYADVPQRYRTRTTPLEIQRGFLDQDEIEITLPPNYTLDAKPGILEIKEKFGQYRSECIQLGDNKIRYTRSLMINKGTYDKSEYENYRKFIEQIAKADNAKIVLNKKT